MNDPSSDQLSVWNELSSGFSQAMKNSNMILYNCINYIVLLMRSDQCLCIHNILQHSVVLITLPMTSFRMQYGGRRAIGGKERISLNEALSVSCESYLCVFCYFNLFSNF